jgi:Lanthionine synthetase C-like protein
VGGAGVTWDEARVREQVRAVVADAEAALDGCVWPRHELDDEVTDAEQTALYLGAAGMIWALRRLGTSLDVDAVALAALERYLEVANPAEQSSLFAGEPALLLLTRSDDERLRALISENEHNPHWELLYGSAGSILAARAAGFDAEAERLAATLIAERDHDGLWTQQFILHNHSARYLGPAHGFAGNIHVLRGFVPDDELRRWIDTVLRAHAVWDDGVVNWPPVVGDGITRTQWCHGAPGIVGTIGDLMAEDLLLAGAETTWRNGPLDKGPGLCHGTAGNGYALLRTYELTQDEVWLERARSFAMDALGQLQNRYSLFTGDIGAALFAQACIDVDSRFPILDVL